MIAEPVAAQGSMPASFDISAMPATAHTLPGMYLPRLETVQMRAAVQPAQSLPPPGEHAAPRDNEHAVHEPHDHRTEEDPRRLDSPFERLGLQLLPVADHANGRP